MLTYPKIQAICKLLAANADVGYAFNAAPDAATARTILAPLVTEDLNEFILYHRSAKGGSKVEFDAAALGFELDSGAWTHGRPPRSALEMADPNRVPSWVNVLADVRTKVADSLRAEQMQDPDLHVRMAIAAHMGMYGYESVARPSVVQASDVTMRLLISDAVYVVSINHPDWFNEAGQIKPLDAIADPRSTDEKLAEEKAKLAEAKKAERAEKARLKAIADRSDYLVARTTAFEVFNADTWLTATAKDVADRLAAAQFADARSTIVIDSWSWLTEEMQTRAAAALPAFKPDLAAHHFEQYILIALSARQPQWLVTKDDSTLAMRRGIGAVKTGLNREELAIRRGLYALVDKYGAELVQAGILAVFQNLGTQANTPDVAAKPEQLLKKDTDEAAPAAPAV